MGTRDTTLKTNPDTKAAYRDLKEHLVTSLQEHVTRTPAMPASSPCTVLLQVLVIKTRFMTGSRWPWNSHSSKGIEDKLFTVIRTVKNVPHIMWLRSRS